MEQFTVRDKGSSSEDIPRIYEEVASELAISIEIVQAVAEALKKNKVLILKRKRSQDQEELLYQQ